jgi:hypothetical protein
MQQQAFILTFGLENRDQRVEPLALFILSALVNRVISSCTANDGSYTWTISSTQALGTDYKIRVTSTSYSSIRDSSNSNFAIHA